jgi:hypothetical protein
MRKVVNWNAVVFIWIFLRSCRLVRTSSHCPQYVLSLSGQAHYNVQYVAVVRLNTARHDSNPLVLPFNYLTDYV